MADFYLTPVQVSELTGVNPSMLRDWRHRGYIDQYGKNETGQWRYSIKDALAIWVAWELKKAGMNREAATLLAYAAKDQTIRAMEFSSSTEWEGFDSISPLFGVGIPEKLRELVELGV